MPQMYVFIFIPHEYFRRKMLINPKLLTPLVSFAHLLFIQQRGRGGITTLKLHNVK